MLAQDVLKVDLQASDHNSHRAIEHRHYPIDSYKPDIVGYIGRFISLRQRGGLFEACCPFHEEKTPSFKVDPKKQTWRCYGACGIGGDVIAFMMQYHNMSFTDVRDELVGADPQTPRLRRSDRDLAPSPQSHEPPVETWQHPAYAAAVQANHFLLNTIHPEAVAARTWLHKRGITDAMIEKHQIGYNPDWKTIGINDDEGKAISLAPGISIPVIADGQLWGIKIRRRVDTFAAALNRTPDCHRDGKPVDKYTWLKGSRAGIPFGIDGFTAGCDVLVVEGEFDAIVTQDALPKVVAITVGSASTPIRQHILDQLKTARHISTLFDNDAAGRNAKPLKQLMALGSKPLSLPEGVKDPTDYLKEGGDLAAWFEQQTQYTAPTQQIVLWETMPDAVGEILHMRFLDQPKVCSKGTENTVRAFNKAFNEGKLNPNGFTIKEAIAVLPLSRSTVTRSIGELENVFFSKVEGIEEGYIPSKTEKNTNAGRKPTIYRLLPKALIDTNLLTIAHHHLKEKYLGDKILARLEANLLGTLVGEEAAVQLAQEIMEITEPARRHDQDQTWRFNKAADRYRQHFARLAQNLESPTSALEPPWETYNPRIARLRKCVQDAGVDTPITRKNLANAARCSKSSLPRLLKLGGIEGSIHEADFEVHPAGNLDKQLRNIRSKNECNVMALVAKSGDRIVASASVISEEWAKEQQHLGRKVYAHVRTGNTYRIVSNEVPAVTSSPKAERAPVPRYITPAPRTPRAALPNHDYFKGHNPEWVFNQLVLAVEVVRGFKPRYIEAYSEKYLTFYDAETDESYAIKDYHDLLSLLLESRANLVQRTRIEQETPT